MKLEFFLQFFFENYSNTKFHENPPSWSGVVLTCGQTDMTKLIVALRNFANAPKNHRQICANGGTIQSEH